MRRTPASGVPGQMVEKGDFTRAEQLVGSQEGQACKRFTCALYDLAHQGKTIPAADGGVDVAARVQVRQQRDRPKRIAARQRPRTIEG